MDKRRATEALNILIAWELGMGMGHLGRYLGVAQLLARRGHKVTFAVKDLRLAHSVLSGTEFAYVQAPRVGRAQAMEHAICNHADILDHHGMADVETCTVLFNAWKQLFALCKPDVVVPDHAPAALFTAKCLGVKTLQLTTGFDIPPAVTPFPSFRPWEKTSPAELVAREAKCLEAMNPFAVAHGLSPYQSLKEALRTDVPLIASFAELDHYSQRRGGRYIGPIENLTKGDAIRWSGHGKYKIFVYLHHLPNPERVLEQLAEMDVEVIAYCPDLGVPLASFRNVERIRLCTRPVQLADVLKECDLLISNGGHGLMAACVLSAVPVLLIPVVLEQRLMADCVRRSGIGLTLFPPEVDGLLSDRIRWILDNGSFKTSAQRLQQKYLTFDLEKSLERIANTVEKLVRFNQSEAVET